MKLNFLQILTPNGFKHLASVPKRISNRMLIRTGDYVVIQSSAYGEKYPAEIIRLIDHDYEMFYRKRNVWPKEYDIKGYVERLEEKIHRAEVAAVHENNLKKQAEEEEARKLREEKIRLLEGNANKPLDGVSTTISDIVFEKNLRKELKKKREIRKKKIEQQEKEKKERQEKKQKRLKGKKKKVLGSDKVTDNAPSGSEPTTTSAAKPDKELEKQINKKEHEETNKKELIKHEETNKKELSSNKVSDDTPLDSKPTATSEAKRDKKLKKQKNKKEHKQKKKKETSSDKVRDSISSDSSEYSTASLAEYGKKLKHKKNKKEPNFDAVSFDTISGYAPSSSDSSESNTTLAVDQETKVKKRKKKNERVKFNDKDNLIFVTGPRKQIIMQPYDTTSSDNETEDTIINSTNTRMLKYNTSYCSDSCCGGNFDDTNTIDSDRCYSDFTVNYDQIPALHGIGNVHHDESPN